jgi:hypothetical protein
MIWKVGLAHLYPAYSFELPAIWISARVRSHSRLGPEGGKSCRTRANQRVSFVEGEGPRLDALKDPAALQILWPAIDHAMSSCDINRKMFPRSI